MSGLNSEIRKIIAHEYEDESKKIAGVINKINEKRNYFVMCILTQADQ